MKNPFSVRFASRFFKVVGIGVAIFLFSAIIDSMFLALVGELVVFFGGLYFVVRTNMDKTKCQSFIADKLGHSTKYIVEAYDPNLEWGFLALTNSSIVFVPKKGEYIDVDMQHIDRYGSDWMGTGEYVTTSSNFGNTGLRISGTRENKSPIFYIEGHNFSYLWHTKKNAKMFNAIEKSLGRDRKNMKANF